MVEILHTAPSQSAFQRVLSEVSNRGLVRFLLLVMEELKARGVWWGLDGPYPEWDIKWGADAIGILEKWLVKGPPTIHPMPNPGSLPSEPLSAGATGPDPDQSNRV